jgi:enoyl-CoA hydratase/carnithine racemase
VVADFRVTCKEARWSANFALQGFHPGFGLSTMLPALIGRQKAALLMYTGRRIDGEQAVAMGLADVLAPQAEVRAAAQALAEEIASNAPLAVMSLRHTLTRDLPNRFAMATEREFTEQASHRMTADYAEGVLAMKERRTPRFTGA